MCVKFRVFEATWVCFDELVCSPGWLRLRRALAMAEGKAFKFKTFTERVNALNVDVVHNLEFVSAPKEGLFDSYFGDERSAKSTFR